MKNTILVLLGSLLFLSVTIRTAGAQARKEMPFEKYGFVRDRFDPKDLEYLMGNAEMGGWTENRGFGFEKLWFTDVWADKEWRQSLPGPLLSNDSLEKRDFTVSEFRHDMDIKYGVTTTGVRFADGKAYESTIFFSRTNKHLLVIHVKNLSTSRHAERWGLRLPFEGFQVSSTDAHQWHACTTADTLYTKIAWSLRCSKTLVRRNDSLQFELNPGDEAVLLYSVATHWDGEDYREQTENAVAVESDIGLLRAQQKKAWDDQWHRIASVILPDGEYARWFYRAVSVLYATSGADRFCAGEEQFSIPDPDWHMHPFTYGHGGGWSVWAFAMLGDKQRAMNIAKWHYNPKALKENVRILFPKLGPVELIYRGRSKGIHTYLEEYNPDAIAFGHEVDTEGHDIPYKTTAHWDLQRHIDGYAAAFYHLLDRYFPDPEFTERCSYPVLRGTAEMYRSLMKWDEAGQRYFLPPLLSVSENIMEKSVLDAVLAARWTLKTASEYADRLGKDPDLAMRWKEVMQRLYVPQNDSTYLEYLDDTQKRLGGGYFGIRAFMYLGFPLLEQIKDIDVKKARRALDIAWQKNNRGAGMITFILNWFALTEAYLGYGQKAYDLSQLTTTIQDSSGTCLVEVISKDDEGHVRMYNKYFLTGYSSFILVPISMMLQSFDSQIRVFPSMPSEWRNAAFYDLQAEGGIQVSARMEEGKVIWISCKKDGETLLSLDHNEKIQIIRQGDRIKLKVE